MNYRPFSNGSQYCDWDSRNCCNCIKYSTTDPDKCEIQNALSEACFGDGTVTEDIAKRMGYMEHKNSYNWRCPEFIPETKNKKEN